MSGTVKLITSLFLVCVVGPVLLSPACREPNPPPPHVASAVDNPDLNVVQREMRALETAMHKILTYIANRDLAPIPDTLFAIHAFRDETEAALKKGLYHPPRKDESIEAFIATDDAFHNDLVRLVKAARANDLVGATKAYGVIVEGCTSCHSRFRFPADTLPAP